MILSTNFLIGVIVVAVLLLLLLAGAVAFKRKRVRGKEIAGSLNLQLFKILLTNEDAEEPGNNNPEEIFQRMEQVYSSMIGMRRKGWKMFRVHPIATFEIALSEESNQTQIYAAVPRFYSSTFEKIVSSLFPGSRIDKTEDYNVFVHDGATRVGRLSLEREVVLPIRTYDRLGGDPFAVIAGVFAKLKEKDEGAAIQFVFRPTDDEQNRLGKSVAAKLRKGKSLKEALKGESKHPWALSFANALGLGVSKKDSEEVSHAPDEETARLVEAKAARSGFNMNIRIIASSKTEDEAERIYRELEAAFLQFAEPQGNSFKVDSLEGKAAEDAIYRFSFRVFSEVENMYLATNEIATIFHFPRTSGATPHVEFLKSKEAPAPNNLAKEGLLMGRNVYRGTETKIHITPEDRRRHMYVIGQTGTGKTAFLKNLIMQDIQEGMGLCFIDPHGDTAEELLSLIPRERVNDVIYFDPADVDRPMGLNFLEYDTKYPEQKTFVVNELFSIFQKLYGDVPESMGPMFEQYFRNATLLVLEDPASGNTLIEVERVLVDAEFRAMKLSRTSNVIVKTFWTQIAEKAGGEGALQNIVPYITSKFDTFLANDIMRPIIAQEKSSFDFRKVMDEKKILLVNLSKGRLGEMNSNLLGLILVGKILMAAFSRADIPEEQRNDFYLYIDEFQNVTTDSISTILSEARKYRLSLTIAHQFIGQLDEKIKQSVFGNVGTTVSFRVGSEDTEVFAKLFSPVFGENDLSSIDNYNAYVNLLINGQTAAPFNIATYPPAMSGGVAVAEAIHDLSRLKYGRPREEVEEQIQRRHAKFTE